MNHCDQVRRDILRLLLQPGHRGATDFDICERLELPGDTVRPRRCELRDRGLIIDSRRRRKADSQKGCIIWIVRPRITLRSLDAKPAARPPSSPPTMRPAARRVSSPAAPMLEANQDPASSEPAIVDRCRCGSIRFVNVVLTHAPHNGNRVRRDCARCGRTVGFYDRNGVAS